VPKYLTSMGQVPQAWLLSALAPVLISVLTTNDAPRQAVLTMNDA
jgi:hypothetical protein